MEIVQVFVTMFLKSSAAYLFVCGQGVKVVFIYPILHEIPIPLATCESDPPHEPPCLNLQAEDLHLC